MTNEMVKPCDQCASHPARWVAMGDLVCSMCRELYLGTFDEGRKVDKHELARMLGYFDTFEAANLMAYTAGRPAIFTRRTPSPALA